MPGRFREPVSPAGIPLKRSRRHLTNRSILRCKPIRMEKSLVIQALSTISRLSFRREIVERAWITSDFSIRIGLHLEIDRFVRWRRDRFTGIPAGDTGSRDRPGIKWLIFRHLGGMGWRRFTLNVRRSERPGERSPHYFADIVSVLIEPCRHVMICIH